MNKIKNFSRRQFLTKSAASLASFGIINVSGKITPIINNKKIYKEPEKKIIYRALGKTGIKIPIVSMGVMNADNPELVRKSYEIGVRHFDTAHGYSRGNNEKIIGDVIKELNIRDKTIIGTKQYIHPEQRPKLTAEEIKKSVLNMTEISLKRLKTDYIDILYYHNVETIEDLKNPGFIEALQLLKEQKKARFIGFSTHRNMTALINEAIKNRVYDVILTTYNYSLSDDSDLFNAIKNAASKGIGIIAMKTQCSQPRYLDNITTDLLKYYEGAISQTAVLKWALRNQYITTSIPGYTNFQQMEEDFSVAYDLEYIPEEKSFLEERGVKFTLNYCHQCNSCISTCPNKVDIPSLMRIHMYATCYANFHQARFTLDSLSKDKSLQKCSSCHQCIAQCANEINIAVRIEELKTIYLG